MTSTQGPRGDSERVSWTNRFIDDRWWLPLCLGAIAIAADFSTPTDVIDEFFYFISVGSCLWVRSTRAALVTAACLSPIIVVGHLDHPLPSMKAGEIFDHAFAFLSLWIIAVLVAHRLALENEAHEAEVKLRESEEMLRESDKHKAFLLRLSDALRPLDAPSDIKNAAAQMLGTHLNVSRALYVDVAGEHFTVTSDYHKGVRSVVGTGVVGSFGKRLVQRHQNGEAVAIPDIDLEPMLEETERERFRAIEVKAFITVSLVKAGKWVGAFVVHNSTPRQWQPFERELVQEVGERIWQAAERAIAERTLHGHSEEKLGLALRAVQMSSWSHDYASGTYEIDEIGKILHGFSPSASSEEMGEAFWHIHPDDLPEIKHRLQAARETKETYQVEYRVLLPSGETRWLAALAKLRPDSASLIGVVRDVTESRTRELQLVKQAHLLDLTSDAIFVRDLDHRITYWNNGAARLYGWAPVEAVGQKKAELLQSEYPEPLEVIHEKLWRQASWEGELIHTCRDGRKVVVASRWVVDYDASGQPTSILESNTDITARKRFETEIKARSSELQQFLDTSEIALTRISRDLTYISANSAYSRDAKLPLDQLVGRPVVEVMGAEAFRRIQPYIDRALQGEAVKYEIQGLFAGFKNRFLQVHLTPWREEDGTVSGFVASVADITLHKEAEEVLRAMDKQKDEFLATLAHELRNPLAPILVAADMLSSGLDAEKLQECRDIISRQLTQMSRLLEDLLDVSRLSTGKMTLQLAAVRLNEVIDAAVETSRPGIDARKHELIVESIDPTITVEGDRARLTQIFANLLNNAAKYTDPGGSIAVRVFSVGDTTRVSVRDTGIGIGPQLREHLFDRTSRAHQQPHPESGLGIGLHLARRLVEMHGGHIEVSSDGQGKGSEFTITLPTTQVAVRTQVTESNAADKTMSRRVLIIDDNADFARAMALFVRVSGGEPKVEHSGERGVEQALSFKPESIILDIGLPDIDGYEVCRRIRGALGSDVQLIALSGWGRKIDKENAARAGFDAHLTKPPDATLLRELLARGSA